MPTYTTNIPQPTDDPSDSQDQILENFQTLNQLYGTDGDHYPWTNQTAVEGSKHAKVTLPKLTTTNPPGNVIPTPTSNEVVIYATQNGGKTRPYYRTDADTRDYPMGAIIALASATRTSGGTLTGVPFNISGVSVASNVWTFTFSAVEPDTDYLIFSSSNTAVTINSKTVANFSFLNLGTIMDVMVIRYN